MEGITIGDILLDTGCSQTLVRQELIPNGKVMSGQSSIRCAHGDVIKYPMAYVRIRVGAMEFTVNAGVSNRLPTSVLLGTDVPVWKELLGGVLAEDDECPQALVVTRSQRAAMEEAEAERVKKEAASGVKLSLVEDEGESSSEPAELEDEMEEASDNSLIGTEFDDELFTEYPDRSTSPGVEFENLNFVSAEMNSQQAEDPTPVAIWAAVEGKASTAGVGF